MYLHMHTHRSGLASRQEPWCIHKASGAYTKRKLWPNPSNHAIILNFLNCAEISTGGVPASEGTEAIRGAGERNQNVPKANGKTGNGGRAAPGIEKPIMPKSLSSYFFTQIELPQPGYLNHHNRKFCRRKMQGCCSRRSSHSCHSNCARSRRSATIR